MQTRGERQRNYTPTTHEERRPGPFRRGLEAAAAAPQRGSESACQQRMGSAAGVLIGDASITGLQPNVRLAASRCELLECSGQLDPLEFVADEYHAILADPASLIPGLSPVTVTTGRGLLD